MNDRYMIDDTSHVFPISHPKSSQVLPSPAQSPCCGVPWCPAQRTSRPLGVRPRWGRPTPPTPGSKLAGELGATYLFIYGYIMLYIYKDRYYIHIIYILYTYYIHIIYILYTYYIHIIYTGIIYIGMCVSTSIYIYKIFKHNISVYVRYIYNYIYITVYVSLTYLSIKFMFFSTPLTNG